MWDMAYRHITEIISDSIEHGVLKVSVPYLKPLEDLVDVKID
jgi:hypothetical protein